MKAEHCSEQWIEQAADERTAKHRWRALEQQGATEQALNDLLGYLEDDLKSS